MSLQRLRGSVVVGLVLAAACATQTNDGAVNAGPAQAGDSGAAGMSSGGSATGGTPTAGAAASGAPSTAGAGSSGAPAAGAAGGSAASGGAGAGMGGGGKGGGGTGGGGMGGGGMGGGGMGGGGAGGASNCVTPTTQTLSSIYDAELNAQAPTANAAYVAEVHIVRGGAAASHRAVFWFDLGAVPAGKTLKTAKLQLTVANNPGLSKTMAVHRVSQSSNRLWQETQVTWQAYKTGSSWTAAGGDFVATASDTQAVADATPSGTVLVFNVLADAQSFYATPSTNYGWLLKDPLDASNPSGENVYIATRENTTITPPKLVLTYCP